MRGVGWGGREDVVEDVVRTCYMVGRVWGIDYGNGSGRGRGGESRLAFQKHSDGFENCVLMGSQMLLLIKIFNASSMARMVVLHLQISSRLLPYPHTSCLLWR